MPTRGVDGNAVAGRALHAATHHELPIRGRSDELAVIGDVIARLRSDSGSLLLLEGPPGIGKSRLLSEVRARALAPGVRPLLGKAFEDQQMVPFAPLFAAFLGTAPPIGDPDVFRTLGASADLRYWVAYDLQSAIAAAARETPLVVLIDDAHWADTGSLMVLRELMGGLADEPVAWVLALRSGAGSPAVRELVGAMARGCGLRTHRIRLGAVSVRAAADIAKDVLRADVDDTLMELTNMAEGNPFLLLELLKGLSEEGRLLVERGRVSVNGRQIPGRLADTMDHRLDRLSAAARQVVQVASVLPETFSAVLLARMVKRDAAGLIEVIGEAVRADLLTEDGDRLRFRHDLLRHAARQSIPSTLRRVLERESATMLLEAGAAPAQVAIQIARSADIGDHDAVVTLRRAAGSLACSDPSAAATLSGRALELVRIDDPQRNVVVAETVRFLNRAQRYDEAQRLLAAALSGDIAPEDEAQIRLSMSILSERGAGERIEQNRRSLRMSHISSRTRAQHLGWLAYNLMLDGQTEAARPAAADAIAAAAFSRDTSVSIVAGLALANVECAEGSGRKGLERLAEVRGRVRPGSVDVVGDLAAFHRANLALTLGRLTEAAEVINRRLDAARRAGDSLWLTHFTELNALRAVAAGRLTEARSIVESVPGGIDYIDDHTPGLIHLLVLTELSAHTDSRTTQRAAGIAARHLMGQGPARRRAAATAQALIAWQHGDADAAGHLLGEDIDLLGTPLFAVTLDHVVLAARIAGESGDLGLRERVMAAADRLEREPNGVPVFTAVARHARGLLRDDADSLEAAAETLVEGERSLLYAAAVEDCGHALARAGHHDRAVSRLGAAFDVYAECESTADARRVGRALHALGVDRRVGRQRVRTGWESLTRSEWRVAELVAEGATNRQVAGQLSVSHHTVNTHLRNVYAKMGIRSRDQLTRLARGDDVTGPVSRCS